MLIRQLSQSYDGATSGRGTMHLFLKVNQRPPAELKVGGWTLEGAGATSAGGR
jgi:hypothetical protein